MSQIYGSMVMSINSTVHAAITDFLVRKGVTHAEAEKEAQAYITSLGEYGYKIGVRVGPEELS